MEMKINKEKMIDMLIKKTKKESNSIRVGFFGL